MAGKLKIGAAIALDGDEKFKKQLKDIEKSMSLTKAESRRLAAEFEGSADSIDALTAKEKLLNKQYDEQKQKVNVIASAVEKYENAQKEITSRIGATSDALEDAKKVLQETADKYGDNAEETKKAKERVDELTDGLKRQEAQQEKIQTSLNDWKTKQVNAETQLIKTEKSIEANDTAIKKLSDNTKTVGERVQDFGQKMSDVSSKITDVGDKADKLGGNLTMAVSAPLIAIGTAGVKAFNEVDDGLDVIVSKTGATGEAMTGFEKIYKDIAGEINADFGDIGAAIGEINTRLGLQGDALHNASTAFLKYARVNGTDVNTSVQLVTRAMADAGIESSEYTRVLDALTVAGQKSGISVDKLAESLAKYGAPMRTLGLDIEDSIALFAAWEKAGVNTEIAFSGMKKAIANWGKEGKDAKVEFANLLKTIKETPDAVEALSIATDAFGSKAANDLTDAIRGGRFEVEEYTKALETAGGTVENTYGEMIDGADDAAIATQQAKIALAEIGETIMKSAAPILQDLSGIIKSVAEWFDGLDDNTRKTIVHIAAIGVVAGPAVSWFGKIQKAVGAVTDGFGKGIKHVGTWIDKLKGIGSATAGADTAMSTLSGSIGAVSASILGSIGLAVAIPTAAAVIGDLMYKQTEVHKANEKLKDSFEKITGAVKDYANAVDGVQANVSIGTFQSEEEQKRISDSVKSAQDKITKITEAAIKERRELSKTEIYEIEKNYKELDKSLSESLKSNISAQEQYQTRVSALIKSQSESPQQYAEEAKQWLADTKALYDESAEKIAQAESNQMSVLDQMLASGTITLEEYERKVDDVHKKYKNQLTESAKVSNNTMGEIADGYLKSSKDVSKFFDDLNALNKQSLENEKEYQQKRASLLGEGAQVTKDNAQQLDIYNREKLRNQNDVATQFAELLDEENSKYLEHYLSMISVTLEQGGELTKNQKEQITALISTFDVLEPETQEKVKSAFEAIGITFDKSGKVMYTDAAGTARKIIKGWEAAQIKTMMLTNLDDAMLAQIDEINRRRPEMQAAAEKAGASVVDGLADGLKSKMEVLRNATGEVTGVIDKTTRHKLEVRSPSHLMRRHGKDTGKGLALGLLDEKADVEKASKILVGIPADDAKKLSMRASIANSYPTRAMQAGQTVSGADMKTFAVLMVQAFAASGLTVQMDSKTVGYLTAAAVGKQLGFNAKRGV